MLRSGFQLEGLIIVFKGSKQWSEGLPQRQSLNTEGLPLYNLIRFCTPVWEIQDLTLIYFQAKCAEYFPKYKQFNDYEDIQVECKQELSFTNYKKRLFYVYVQNEEIQVVHYHFQKWMDHDCPRSPEDLIKFVKIVRNERKNLANPLVVHCR